MIHPNVTIYPGVRIGDRFTAHSGVSIREGTVIGNRVTLLNGAVIGADGFGFVEENRDLIKIPQVGSVILEDDVEIGANSTVDRAMMGATILHRGVKLDDQVHIGHNCEIGEYSRFSGHTGISGSTRIGKWCLFGGQVGCADHVTIGDRVMVVAKAGIHNDSEGRRDRRGHPRGGRAQVPPLRGRADSPARNNPASARAGESRRYRRQRGVSSGVAVARCARRNNWL